MHRMARRRTADDGFTLVEVLLAVVIMATATITLGAVLISLFTLTEQHRGATATDGVLRSYVEAVEQSSADLTASTYVPCPPAANPAQLTPSGFSLPAGYTNPTITVEYWNPKTSAFESGSTGRNNCFTNYNNTCAVFGQGSCNLDSSSTAPLADLCPVCDPGLLRVTVKLTKNDGSGQHGAITYATQIFLRRANLGGTT